MYRCVHTHVCIYYVYLLCVFEGCKERGIIAVQEKKHEQINVCGNIKGKRMRTAQ